MKLRLIAANDSLFIRSFGVAHTHFVPVFVPCLPRMMTNDFITADFATVTACKLYRFHYNLLVAVPVNWPVVKHCSSAQITGNQRFKLFRLWNKLGRGFGLTC
jgi:hypothetical protein